MEDNGDRVGGVWILLAEKWVDKAIEVVIVCDKVLKYKVEQQQLSLPMLSSWVYQMNKRIAFMIYFCRLP